MGNEVLHIYCRVSSSSQEDNTSLQQQREKGIRLAGILGFDHKIWNEGAASGSKDDLDKRPVLVQLLTEINDGGVKHIYAEYQDRLSRSATTWGAIRYAFRENNVLFYSQLDTKPVDLRDPMDELIFGIMSVISQFDNRIREQRLSSGKFQRVSEGKWQGGPAPFGYKIVDHELVVDENESKWVQTIYDEYRKGKSHRDIQDLLRSNGVLTRRGNTEFSIGSIDKILTNSHYTGTYQVTRQKTGETWSNTCPIIISKQLRDDVKQLKQKRSIKRGVPTNRKYFTLLKDMIVCGDCGRTFRGRQTPSQKQFIYFDPTNAEKWRRPELKECKGVKSINMNETDDLIKNIVIDVVEKSHIFREQIKRVELTDDSYQLSVNQLKSTKRKIRDLDKKIVKYSESIGMLKADVMVGNDKVEKLSTIEKLELDKEKLIEERGRTIDAANEGEKGKRWRDWYLAFKDKVDDLRSMEVGEELQTFLKQIVDQIVVFKDGEDKVMLDIHFTLPFYEDELVYFDINDKKKGYEIVDGKSNYLIEYQGKKTV